MQTAFNGPSGIEKAREFQPHMVLLDIGMSGYEVARSLRVDPQCQGIVITALTGYGQAEDLQRSKEAGFHFHLTKPPDPVALAKLIESPLPT